MNLNPLVVDIIIAFFAAVIGWLLAVFWDKYRGPRITLEKITLASPDEFEICLRNTGRREASECIVVLEAKPLPEVKEMLGKLSIPTSRRVESYMLEELDADILYSCWPITRDVILPDMTDMKPGPAYSFVGRLPEFLKLKKNLQEGQWTKIISFPKNPAVYLAAVSVYDGIDTSFILIYDNQDAGQKPKILNIGSIRKPRKIGILWVRFRLWLLKRKYRESIKES